MSELEQTNTLLPAVSFATEGPKITYAQHKIIEFIKEKIQAKEPITRYDILILYCETYTQNKDRTIRLYCWYKNEFGWHNKVPFIHAITTYEIKNKAIGWFKTNLGSAIVKGKLMVIPIIEI